MAITTRAEQVHQGRSGGQGADPAHIFAQQIARGFAEFPDFEAFHAEGFYTRLPLIVSCRIWLRSARRERLFSVELRMRRPNLPTGQTTSGIRTAEPTAILQSITSSTSDEGDQAENLAEKIRQTIGEGAAHLLDIVDHRGHHAADGIVAERSRPAAARSCRKPVAQIGDRRRGRHIESACCRNIPQTP